MKNYCGICQGNSDCEVLYKRQKETFAKKQGQFSPVAQDFGIYYNIIRCGKCGHIFADNDPKEKILEKYEEAEDPGSYLSLWKFRENNCARALKKALQFCAPSQPLRVLDVGAGGGIAVRYLQSLGHDVIGVEPSRALVKMAKEKMGVSLLSGTLDQLLEEGASFDLICMLEVIEHLQSPAETIKTIRHLLKEGGILLITTPNINSFGAQLLGKRWWSFRGMHLHYFSPKTLCKLVGQFGFFLVFKGIFFKTFPLSYFLKNLKLEWVPTPCFNLTVSLGDTTVIFKKHA